MGAKKSTSTVFFSPAGLHIGDDMPQEITVTLEYFIPHFLTLLHQHKMSLSQDAARRKLNLHVDDSRCKRVAHPPYFHDLAIRDFCLFSRRKDKRAGFHADKDTEVLREIQGILIAIDRPEVKNAFEHCAQRYQCVATNEGEYSPE
jgi:hypothetical protein